MKFVTVLKWLLCFHPVTLTFRCRAVDTILYSYTLPIDIEKCIQLNTYASSLCGLILYFEF